MGKDVIFNYDDINTTIKIDNFLMLEGEKITIMGEFKQGKTTFLNILYKNLLISEGVFLINGEDKDTLLDIAYVSQETELFDLSIYDNIYLGKEDD